MNKFLESNAKVLVCTHATFRFAVDKFGIEVFDDRFGKPVKPKEWFLVPLEVIEEVIEKIKEGTIEQFRYDPKTASLTGALSVAFSKS